MLTKIYYGPKTSIECPFFRFQMKKLLLSCPFLTENVRSLKNTMLPCPYLVQKRPFSQKHESFVSNFEWKTPCCHTHIWLKNVNSAKTTLLYGRKKSIRWFLFWFFTKKSMLTCPYFIKNTSILSKNTLLSSPYYVKITSILWKTCFLISFFFQIFYEESEKKVILSTLLVLKIM